MKQIKENKRRSLINAVRERSVMMHAQSGGCAHLVRPIAPGAAVLSWFTIVQVNCGVALNKQPYYTRSHVLCILNGVASALRFMHSIDLYHRDVKPSNVLVRVLGTHHCLPVLCDYGSSVTGHQTTGVFMESRGITTARYTPPEAKRSIRIEGQHSGATILNNASIDKWSFGCLCLYMFKHPMFDALDAVAGACTCTSLYRLVTQYYGALRTETACAVETTTRRIQRHFVQGNVLTCTRCNESVHLARTEPLLSGPAQHLSLDATRRPAIGHYSIASFERL